MLFFCKPFLWANIMQIAKRQFSNWNVCGQKKCLLCPGKWWEDSVPKLPVAPRWKLLSCNNFFTVRTCASSSPSLRDSLAAAYAAPRSRTTPLCELSSYYSQLISSSLSAWRATTTQMHHWKMVSVLPSGPSLFGPPNMEFYPPTYHVPRVSSSKNIHLRSSSMPEAVFIQQQQQLAAFKPGRVRHPSGHHQAPVMVSLRRSHTNVADLPRKGFRPRYYEGCELPGLYVARSRSNIAAMGLKPENVYRPSQGLPSKGISRAASFYHHRELNSRSMGFLASANSRSSLALPTSQSCKDLSQPLHVDCSVEYDLGHQPKIPKDSAPLLIIHPAFQNTSTNSVNVSNTEVQNQQTRFHPYSSIPSSPYSEVDHKSKSSSGHGTSLASSSLSSTSSASHKLPTSALPPPPPKAGPQHHIRGYSNKVARHSSFLVTSPPKMVALSRMTPNNKFHLSMPDIAGQEADVQAGLDQRKFAASAPNRGRSSNLLYNQKAQHVHHQNSKARLNLNAKLEAVRKLSSSSVESSSHCDSGLGTPISLMEAASSSTTASQSSSHLSKWRSSMSGKPLKYIWTTVVQVRVPPSPRETSLFMKYIW